MTDFARTASPEIGIFRAITKTMKRPSFQFYPGDWMHDTALRSCSLEARGLWIDMLCLMHQGQPYGHLTVGQKRIELPVLARMVGATDKAVKKSLAELEDAGVFTRTSAGIIYSRRMVRDEEIRQVRAAGGVKSLDHPNVPKQKEGPPKDHRKGILPPYPSGGPLLLQSSSSASEKNKTKVSASPMHLHAELHPDSLRSSGSALLTSQSQTADQISRVADSGIIRKLPASASCFEQFWQAYPKKRSKGDAEKVWAKIRPTAEVVALIMAKVREATCSDSWQKDDGKYIPHPATWLNAQGWLDEYQTRKLRRLPL